MSWNNYLASSFPATLNATLVGSSTTVPSGGSWPNDSNHIIGSNPGAIVGDGNGGLYFGGGTSDNGYVDSSATLPATFDFEVIFGFKRLSSLSGPAQSEILLSCGTNPLGFPSGRYSLNYYEAGVGSSNIGWAFWEFTGSANNLSGTAWVPTVGTAYTLKATAATSGGNTAFKLYYSTDGGVTYTSAGVDATTATPTFGVAAGALGFAANGTTGWTQTTGPHLVGPLVTQDPSATSATLGLSASSGPAGAQVTGTVTLDKPAGYGGVVVTPTVTGLTPNAFTIAAGSSSGTFTFTPPTAGSYTVAFTTSPVLSYSGTPQTYTATSASATTYAITGPSGGVVGQPSGNFTITPNGLYSGTITVTPSGCGLSTPIVRTWSASAAPQTFALPAPSSAGTVTLTPTNSGGLTNPTAPTYAVSAAGATSYNITGPAGGLINQPSGAFAVTPNGQYSGTITITPSGCGLSTPVVLTWSASSAPQAFTLPAPNAVGTVTLTPTNSGGLTDPAAPTYIVSAAPATSYTISGASTGYIGQASGAITVTPNGPVAADVVTITVAGLAGTLSSTALTFVNSSSPQVVTFTGAGLGTAVLTFSSRNLSVTNSPWGLTIREAPITWTKFSLVENFNPGLATVGYTVYNPDGTVYQARTTAGVVAYGTSGTGATAYGASIAAPVGAAYPIRWDDGQASPTYAWDVMAPNATVVNGQPVVGAYSLQNAVEVLL